MKRIITQNELTIGTYIVLKNNNINTVDDLLKLEMYQMQTKLNTTNSVVRELINYIVNLSGRVI